MKMKTMKLNLDLITMNLFALGFFIMLFIIPGKTFAADSIYDVTAATQVNRIQNTDQESEQTVVARSDEDSLRAERRMRLQTVENITRSQQTIRRSVSPRL